MKQKLTSRKWIAAIIGTIFTMTATAGYDMPISEVALTDAVLMVYIAFEALVDIARMRFGK